MDIREWTKLFLKHQDLLKKEIEEITDADGRITVSKSGGTEEWFANDALGPSLDNIDQRIRQGIVCLNTQANLDQLLRRWSEVKNHLSLKIVFANPAQNQRWILVPSHHARIADDATLKQGLEAMFHSVPAA